MQFMKHLVAAAALTVAGSAMAALSTTQQAGTLSVGQPDSLTYLAVSYTGPQTFADIINFTVSTNVSGLFTAKIPSFATSSTSGLTLSIYNNGSNTALTATNGAYNLLANTSYSFRVGGTTTGLGAYSVNYFLTPTPAVPEAGSVALTLAGLGVVGVVAARRRRV